MRKEYLALLAAGCVAANAANVNYDLLGRKDSKMNSPRVYKNVDYSKMKKKEEQNIGSSLNNNALAKRASGIQGDYKAIVGAYFPNGYYFNTCSGNSVGCGGIPRPGYKNKADLPTYLNSVKNKFINVESDETGVLQSGYNYVSAGPSRSYIKGYSMEETPYVVTNPVQPSTIQSNTSYTFVPFSSLYSFYNRNYLNKSNVGVYLAEDAVPTRLNKEMNTYAPFILANNASMDNFNAMPGYEIRASRMYRAVEYTSGRSVLYAAKSRPTSPSTAKPQIYMGLHSYGGSNTSNYGSKAKNLDNYIYDNRTIEVVAAGNNPNYFAGEALAVNAFTVGALDPLTNQPIGYSAKCDGYGCNTFDKPEVYNYTHYYFDYPNMPEYSRKYTSADHVYEYKPFYEGTEAAAAVTAGMISNMLSSNDFYKWHPEVVKAVMQNVKYERWAANYDDLVFDQSDKYNVHHSYYFIGNVNTLMKEYSDTPVWTQITETKRKEIRLSFSKSDLMKGFPVNSYGNLDGFYASIAWLNSGNDIANLGGLPQTFEIEGIVNKSSGGSCGVGRKHDSSLLNDNQRNGAVKSIKVEGLSCEINNNMSLTLRIVLMDEDSRSENYGQMVLGLDIKPIFR